MEIHKGDVEFLEKRLESKRVRIKHINKLLWKELCKKKKKNGANGPRGADIETVWQHTVVNTDALHLDEACTRLYELCLVLAHMQMFKFLAKKLTN